ncbi:MAG: phosphomannomutase [Halolamina sp.]
MDLFGTAGIRGPASEQVTPSLALRVGQATARDAVERAGAADPPEFVVGRDGRETGAALAAAMEAGLTSAGADVHRVGVVPTPALAFASRGRRGVMLTASHNPPADNGIKLFADGEEYGEAAEARIETGVAAEPAPTEWDGWGERRESSPLSAYRDAVAGFAADHGAALDGLSVAVDCGNGVAGVATPQVLRALGADVDALNATVDGHFPGRESKPTPETLTDLREYVAAGDHAFGVGHDGDADRIVVVGPDGDVVHEDTVVAILAEHYVRTVDAADPVVVTTPNASGRIDERVRAAGGRVERVALGYLHDGVAAAREDGATVAFAAEPWKHVHTQFGGWIDAVVSAAVFARLVAAEGLAGLREPVTERPYRKGNVECPDAVKSAAMGRLETALPEAFPDAEVATEYGVRLTFPDDAWLLVRPSGTEPYVRVYAESDDVDDLVAAASDVVADVVGRFD